MSEPIEGQAGEQMNEPQEGQADMLLDEQTTERKLVEAFDRMGPDAETRARMLDAILAADKASVAEPTVQAVIRSTTAARKNAAHRPRQRFSFVKYILPVAACLILAAGIPTAFPLLMNAMEKAFLITYGIPPETMDGFSSNNNPDGALSDPNFAGPPNSGDSLGNLGMSGTENNPGDEGNPLPGSPSGKDTDEWPTRPPSVIDAADEGDLNSSSIFDTTGFLGLTKFEIILLIVSLTLCLVALVITLMGLRAWRRSTSL